MAIFFKILQNNFSPLPYHFVCEQYLFNDPVHLKTQKPFDDVFTFLYLNDNDIFARLNIFVVHNQGFSPIRATFGGIETCLNEYDLSAFLQNVIDFLKIKNVESLQINCPPNIYESEQIKNNVLISHGFEIMFEELNFHFSITDKPLSLHVSEKRKLKKCKNAAFVFQKNNIGINHFYDFLIKARNHRQIPISMNFERLESVFQSFPREYQIFCLENNQEIVAALVGIQVCADVMYIFCPASNPRYQQFSPMVLLINELYDYCQQVNYKILDWGIATEKGIKNLGLINFKQKMGAISSKKLSWNLSLSI
jgi:Acetyltransferase (GNAT) domain